MKKELDSQIKQKIRQARDAELKRLERAPWVPSSIPTSIPPSLRSGGTQVRSSRQLLEVPGPDDLSFVIEPYGEGYVWKIRNGNLKSAPELRIKVTGVLSFDAARQAFRETVPTNVQWTVKSIGAGEVTKGIILVRVSDEQLELSENVGLGTSPLAIWRLFEEPAMDAEA